MKKESAIKYIINHINGKENKISNIILYDIASSIINAGGIPPFKIIKIGQISEEIEKIIDDDMEEIGDNSEKTDSSEEPPSENEPYVASPGPAIYNMQNGDLILSNIENKVFTNIELRPSEEQRKLLIENIGDDRMTVNGEAILMDIENNTSGISVLSGFDGIIIFNPLSKKDNSKIDENIYGYYSM